MSRTFGRASLAVFYFLFNLVTKRALMALHCVDLDGISYLYNDMSVICDSPAYRIPRLIAYIALGAYGFGLPFYFLYMLLRDRKDGLKRLDGSVPPSRFLRSGYSNEFFWWEILIMFRKFVITILVVYMAEDPPLQIIIAVYFFLFWIILQVICKPFTDSLAHTLELLSLGVLFSTLLSSLTFFEEPDYADIVTIILFVVNVATLIVLGHVLFKLFGVKIKRFFLRRKMKKDNAGGSFELQSIKMISNPLHKVKFDYFDSSDEEEEMAVVRQALNVSDVVRISKQGPYTLYSEDLLRLNMLPSDANPDLVEDIALEFSSSAVGIVDVHLSFTNSLVPPQLFTIQAQELEACVKLNKCVNLDFIELDSAAVHKYIRNYFKW
ncbi:hypothetical protein GEMRC1_006168 [Eukaryota sp. GEM-RC1]